MKTKYGNVKKIKGGYYMITSRKDGNNLITALFYGDDGKKQEFIDRHRHDGI